jgi:hypothetical protein
MDNIQEKYYIILLLVVFYNIISMIYNTSGEFELLRKLIESRPLLLV